MWEMLEWFILWNGGSNNHLGSYNNGFSFEKIIIIQLGWQNRQQSSF